MEFGLCLKNRRISVVSIKYWILLAEDLEFSLPQFNGSVNLKQIFGIICKIQSLSYSPLCEMHSFV